jgi:spore coat polysaccharide biosynthesis protein SpsF
VGKKMILAILQARQSSSRLPGKVLKPILGVPMLLRQIERIKCSVNIDQLLVATSVEESDDPIVKLCIDNNIKYFRGDLENVLDRFYHAALPYSPSDIVRLTGDCPLTDASVIDTVIKYHKEHEFDYTSNTIERTFPVGLDVEVFRLSCLKEAWTEASTMYQKEHVTPFIYEQQERYKIGSYLNSTNLSYLRWTVDTDLDFKFVTKIYEYLYDSDPHFNSSNILSLLENYPELKNINASI